MQRFVLAYVLCSGCMIGVATPPPQRPLTDADTNLVVPHTVGETQQLVIEKLSLRGFPLVARHVDGNHVELQFGGNRDFSGVMTIGSMFYATVTPVASGVTRVTLLGRPTVYHKEICPPVHGEECMDSPSPTDWALSGREEANAIIGVFAELKLDAALATRGGDGL